VLQGGQEIGFERHQIGGLGIGDWRGLNKRIEWAVTRPPFFNLSVEKVCHHTPDSGIDLRGGLADWGRFDWMMEMAMAMHHH
jgi:hypothetical protein